MELKLVNGDYVPDGTGGFVAVDGPEEVLNRVLFKLAARRGRFEPLPDLGSRLYTLPSCKDAMLLPMARQFVLEAVSGEAGLTLEDLTLERTDRETLAIRCRFAYSGQPMETVTEVEV